MLSSDTKVESGREPEQSMQFCLDDRVVSGPLVDDMNSRLIITMNDNNVYLTRLGASVWLPE